MSLKWVAGGCAILVLIGSYTVGATKVRQFEVQEQAEATPVSDFVKKCRRAVPDKGAAEICQCMGNGLDGRLNNEQEYELAAAIVKAIVSSNANRHVMQANFNQVSQDFYGKVSIARKAAILRIVSQEGVACGKAHS